MKTPETRKIYELLTFYKKSNTLINFKYKLSDIIIKGFVEKASWNSFFPFDPYVIMKSEDGVLNKIFLEDIEERTIFSEDVNVSEVKIEKEEFGEKPKVRKSIPKSIRNQLWFNNFRNNFKGQCYVCKNVIRRDNYEVGHVVSFADGGSDTIDNLQNICRDCNRSMGYQNLNDFMRDRIPK